ncbi:KICSTOR complex protein kaptin [Chionoecetes opilio]|uniref:KICSTOR complex protein kaptin n=1 Tax=Chionoecetes opilio TaxID=41210 RepID=A0A8J4YLS1_CHIOP|nr:KICSTOR complex protein kaptin [Chionoecetes opilio]
MLCQTVWLLSGSDHRIHVYHSDKVSYQEEDRDSPSFPEFSSLTQITLWMDILYSPDKKRRVSAVGGEGGKVEVFGVTLDPLPHVTSSQSVSWDYPISSVNIFNLKTTLPVPMFLKGTNSYSPQVVLVYKLREEDEEEDQEESSSPWRVQHTMKLPCPVLSIIYCDVTGDGCFELVIMTTAGIHIFQHDPRDMAALVLRRLRALTEHEKLSALGT